MAKFLITSGTSANIEEIILTAEKSLTLVTPYLQINKTLEDRLQDADRRGTQITIIYGKSKLDDKQDQIIKSLKHLDLYYLENLHAKCYYNEKMMVISSMNLYEFSEKNNREMGILIDAKADQDIYKDALREVESMKQSKQTVKQSKKAQPYESSYQKSNNSSYKENSFSKPSSPSFKNNNTNQSNYSTYNKSKEVIPELDSRYSEQYNFHLPSLYKTLKQMYPYTKVYLDEDMVNIDNFPNPDTSLMVSSRVDFIFSNDYYANKVRNKIQYKLRDKMPEIRFYWNQDKLNIYPESNFNPDISIAGVAEKINKFIRIIKHTADLIQEAMF